MADFVAKAENPTTPKILEKLIFRLLGRCNTLKRPYDGAWVVLLLRDRYCSAEMK